MSRYDGSNLGHLKIAAGLLLELILVRITLGTKNHKTAGHHLETTQKISKKYSSTVGSIQMVGARVNAHSFFDQNCPTSSQSFLTFEIIDPSKMPQIP